MDIYTRHKPTRNKIKKYTPLSIIGMGIDKLREGVDSAESPHGWIKKEGTYLPWHIMTLIRWVFQYTENSVKQRDITLPEFNDLYNAIHDLNSSIKLEGVEQVPGIDAPIRRMLYCQLPYQVRDYEVMSSFGRQLILFRDLGEKYQLPDIFEKHTGFSIEDYFILYVCCWQACKENPKLSIPFFRDFFPEETTKNFFATLALDLHHGKKFIRQYTDSRASIDYQFNEHTPLERYPFFEHNGYFIPYSLCLMDSSLIHNAYDIFKEINPQFSGRSGGFGDVFEEYVNKGVALSCSSYMRESQIKSILPRDSKVADFLVKEEKGTLLIDAKSTELHPIARVLQNKESTIRNMKDTIISGVVQVLTTAHHLKEVGEIEENRTIYGIIVTYKEYLIGEGKRFWDNVIGETVEAELKCKQVEQIIPPENLFYISIEDFDYLVAGAKERSIELTSVFREAVTRNQSPETSALMFKQHLDALWDEYYRPEYVSKRSEECFDEFRRRFDQV